MAVNPNLQSGLTQTFDLGQSLQQDDELLNSLITGLAGASKDAGLKARERYRGHVYWLKDTLATSQRNKLRRDEFTNGLGVEDEVEKAKFDSVANQIQNDLEQLSSMRQENVQAYMEAVRGILKSSPSHPAVAALAKPNKDQMGLAIALAVLAPKGAANVAMSLAQNQIAQQQQQQQINDLDFEAQLRDIDAQIGLAGEEFKAKDKILTDEFSAKEDRRRFDEQQAIAREKNDANTLEYKRRLTNDVAKAIENLSDKSPSAVKALLGLSKATTGLEDADIDAIVNDAAGLADRKARADEANILKTQANTAATEAGALLTQEKIVAQQQANQFFSDTYQSRVTEFEERAKGYGLDNKFKELRNKKAEIELPYVEKEILASIAHTEASTEYLRQLRSASISGNSKVNKALDLEIAFAADDLKAAEKALADAEKRAQETSDGFRAAESARRNGLTDESGNPLVTDGQLQVLIERMNNSKKAVERHKKAVTDMRNAIRNLEIQGRNVEEAEEAEALRPTIEGPIKK